MSKSDQIRELLKKGKSVNEAAKATGAAYSQAHSVAKAMGDVVNGRLVTVEVDWSEVAKNPKALPKAKVSPKALKPGTYRAVQASPSWGELPPTGRPSKKPAVGKPPRGAANPKVGKLRIPGLPRDTTVGECANCGHQLLVRPTPTGFVLVHTGLSAEEYIAVGQFCQAVPRSLLS